MGRNTKYTEEIGEAFTKDLACMNLQETCKKHKICVQTYYSWLYSNEEFLELSTRARETRATYHFDKAAKVIEELDADPNNIDTRTDIARLRFDGNLRLAGKANQGLCGDKVATINNNTQINNNTTIAANEQLSENLMNLININKKPEEIK